MADYTDQSTDSLLPGEPWTSAKALACFENPVAIAEGAAGAPRIQAEALGPQEVNEPAMRVTPTSVSVELTATRNTGDTQLIELPGNLIFLPKLIITSAPALGSIYDVQMTFGANNNLIVSVGAVGGDEPVTYNYIGSVTWYRIIP